MRTGVASFTLDYGHCPAWLFARMTRLGRVIATAIIAEFGSAEFIRRLSDPVWFQSLGTLMAFDWNASGLTIVTMAALKEALRGMEKDANVYIAGGKGKTSRKTPEQIRNFSNVIGHSQQTADKLVYSSKAAAKVDSALVQDGFQLYHHNFIFNSSGLWVVVQQGMNPQIGRARRYHWLGSAISDFTEEPHSGISTQAKLNQVLNLTAKPSTKNKTVSLELVHDSKTLYRDLKILADKKSNYQFKVLTLPGIEFHEHPDFLSPQLNKAIQQAVIAQPNSFESFLMTPGIGPRTVRALSLVAEVIYGAAPSYDDPARYSFALGGKDGTPYPVDRPTYDKTLSILERAISTARLPYSEKEATFRRIEKLSLLPLHPQQG
jgi:hypothetical protein